MVDLSVTPSRVLREALTTRTQARRTRKCPKEPSAPASPVTRPSKLGPVASGSSPLHLNDLAVTVAKARETRLGDCSSLRCRCCWPLRARRNVRGRGVRLQVGCPRTWRNLREVVHDFVPAWTDCGELGEQRDCLGRGLRVSPRRRPRLARFEPQPPRDGAGSAPRRSRSRACRSRR